MQWRSWILRGRQPLVVGPRVAQRPLPPRRPRLLDAGTGTGQDCFALASELMELERLGAVDTFELICMDVSSAALQLARRRFDHRAIPKVYWPRFVHGSFTDAALLRTLGPFDYILAEGSIHHNDNPAAAR